MERPTLSARAERRGNGIALIRMIKLRQKISGCWRTSAGADHFLALRAYLSTARKQGRHTIALSPASPPATRRYPKPLAPDRPGHPLVVFLVLVGVSFYALIWRLVKMAMRISRRNGDLDFVARLGSVSNHALRALSKRD